MSIYTISTALFVLLLIGALAKYLYDNWEH